MTEQVSHARVALFEAVYSRLSSDDQAQVDAVLRTMKRNIPKLGASMSKELFVSLALFVAMEEGNVQKGFQGAHLSLR